MSVPTLDLSIVIPLLDEEESLTELHDWIQKVVVREGLSYEVIFIDDGSSDKSWKVIRSLSEVDPNVKGISFRRNYGKSAALHTGFEVAKGNVVITMDADLQDSPEEIPGLLQMINEENFDIVSGWKKDRFDPITKTIPTKLFNSVTRKMSKIKLHDFNCGLKAYKNEVVKNINVYGEMHRYIPVLAKWAGFSKIGEKVVKHQARKYGTTKFGLERFVNGFLDLLSIFFVGKFGKRPMHFFGAMGTISFFVGVLILAYLSVNKLIYDVDQISQRPLFFLGVLAIIVGTQLFATGFLAELVIRNSQNKDHYQIKDVINSEKI